VHLFNAHEAVVADNRIEFVRDGIYVAHTSRAVFRGNRIQDSRYGIHYMYSHHNVIENNILWRNVAGPALMFSHDLRVSNNILRDHAGFRAYGLLLQDIEHSRFEGNQILGNRVGMRLQNCNENVFVGNRIGGNISGMTMDSSSGDNTFTRNIFGFNLQQVELMGASQTNQWSLKSVGNRWYDSMPLDLNGDGISEWPHHEVDLMGAEREAFPPVQLLVGSPGIRILEWALQRAPVPGLRYVTDPHPLTRSFGDDAGATHQ
jgi:nitrous oxidase accessory protein